MRAEDRVRVLHMIDAAETVASFIAGRVRDDLDHDRLLLFTVVHAIEVIGEAAVKVSEETRAAAPGVGAAFFWLAFSDELRRPINEILGAGVRTERGVELFYNYAVRSWLRLTPDLQIVRQGLPGRTAIVGGFRAELRF